MVAAKRPFRTPVGFQGQMNTAVNVPFAPALSMPSPVTAASRHRELELTMRQERALISGLCDSCRVSVYRAIVGDAFAKTGNRVTIPSQFCIFVAAVPLARSA